MRAARFHGQKDIRVDEIDEPEVSKGQVKIKVAWNGICGSDLHEYLMGPMIAPGCGHPHPLTGETVPLTFGHEMSGTIVELGEGVDSVNFPIGKNVVVEPMVSCMQVDSCIQCHDGFYNICPKLAIIGMSGFGGGLGEFVVVKQEIAHVIPDNIPLDVAACIEPLAVAWHAVNRAHLKTGDTCLIVGGGPIGLFVLKVLKARGAGAVYVSEPAQARRKKATVHQADVVFDPFTTDVVSECKRLTDGDGVDIAFDCAGVQASLDCVIASTRPRGMIMNVALWEAKATFDPMALLATEKTYSACVCYTGVHKDVIEAVARGHITNVEDLITSKITLEDVVAKGYEALVRDKDNQIKILVHPSPVAPT